VVDCAKFAGKSDPAAFYNSPAAQADFANRITYILNHKNDLLGGRAWKDLSEAIFSFQAENEPRYYANPKWLGAVSSVIKNLTDIPVSSGGPEGGLAAPPPMEVAKDPSIDILTFHDYKVRLRVFPSQL
jgi:hypothetical protein